MGLCAACYAWGGCMFYFSQCSINSIRPRLFVALCAFFNGYYCLVVGAMPPVIHADGDRVGLSCSTSRAPTSEGESAGVLKVYACVVMRATTHLSTK